MRHTMSTRGWVLLGALLSASLAQAQSFPGEWAWVPLRCGSDVMTDPFRDESGATASRDLVGTAAAPTGYRASDGSFLFLRMRLDEDPLPGGNPNPFAWGLLLDTDGDFQDYEALLLANGVGATVELYRNTTTTLPNDPTDPPDDPAVESYPISSHARSVLAAGTSEGGNADYFLEVAIPWADLAQLGVTPSTPVSAWAATSSTSTSLNGDFACFDDGSGDPTLSGTAPGRTVLDPGVDSDHDGFTDATEVGAGTNPHDASSVPPGSPDARQLAGGGGCSTAGGAGVLALAALLAALLLQRRQVTACSRDRRRYAPPSRPF